MLGDNRFDQRLEEERADLIEIVGLALGEALDDQREDARQQLHEEVRALRIDWLSCRRSSLNSAR